MAITNNPIDSVSTLPSLAALQRRRNELNAYQSWQRSQQTSAPLAEQEPELEEESSGSPEPEFPDDPPRGRKSGPFAFFAKGGRKGA